MMTAEVLDDGFQALYGARRGSGRDPLSARDPLAGLSPALVALAAGIAAERERPAAPVLGGLVERMRELAGALWASPDPRRASPRYPYQATNTIPELLRLPALSSGEAARFASRALTALTVALVSLGPTSAAEVIASAHRAMRGALADVLGARSHADPVATLPRIFADSYQTTLLTPLRSASTVPGARPAKLRDWLGALDAQAWGRVWRQTLAELDPSAPDAQRLRERLADALIREYCA